MTTTDEDWVNDALTDDSVVADMLIRLRAVLLPPPPKRKASSSPLQLEWTVRQRRSRPAARHLADSPNNSSHHTKKAEPTRASPTTPLSWSGATSLSGGAADGFEESSRPARPLDPARSKVLACTTSETTTTKRPRKKKTLAELKEEESLLLKERRSLKNELATLRLRLESQRAKNESLKRMKLDFPSHQTFKTVTSSVASEETISDQLQHAGADSFTVTTPSNMATDMQSLYLDTVPHSSLLNCSSKVQEVESKDTGFLLPDLNEPLDDESGSKV